MIKFKKFILISIISYSSIICCMEDNQNKKVKFLQSEHKNSNYLKLIDISNLFKVLDNIENISQELKENLLKTAQASNLNIGISSLPAELKEHIFYFIIDDFIKKTIDQVDLKSFSQYDTISKLLDQCNNLISELKGRNDFIDQINLKKRMSNYFRYLIVNKLKQTSIEFKNGFFAHLVKESIILQKSIRTFDEQYSFSYQAKKLIRNLKLMTYLVLAKVDINMKVSVHIKDLHLEDFTALMVAASSTVSCAKELMQFLINAGANPNIQNNKGNTALWMALSSGNFSLEHTDILIKAGANVNIQNHKGITALLKAIDLEELQLVNILLDAQADVNIRDDNENTPLYVAIDLANVKIIKALLDAGADVIAVDKDGTTALDIVLSSGNKKIIELFKQFNR